MPHPNPLVGVVMGSRSDLEIMRHCTDTLEALGVAHEVRIISAHRAPDLLRAWATGAERRGVRVIIAAAGGAAHLPGVTAALTPLPVLGVPMEGASLRGLDALLAIVQMPAGIPVGTLAIGKAGAINAALLAGAILSGSNAKIGAAVRTFRRRQTRRVESDSVVESGPTQARPKAK